MNNTKLQCRKSSSSVFLSSCHLITTRLHKDNYTVHIAVEYVFFLSAFVNRIYIFLRGVGAREGVGGWVGGIGKNFIHPIIKIIHGLLLIVRGINLNVTKCFLRSVNHVEETVFILFPLEQLGHSHRDARPIKRVIVIKRSVDLFSR